MSSPARPVPTFPENISRLEQMANDPDMVAPDEPGKPKVLTPGAHLKKSGEYLEVGNNGFCAEILSRIPESVLYRRAEQVGTLSSNPMVFRRISLSGLRNMVDEHVSLTKWYGPKNGIPEEFFQNTSDDHAAIILSAAEGSPRVRDLKVLTSFPVCVGPDFAISKPGWNADYGVYYDAASEIPVIRDFGVIKATLEDLTVDFPFASDIDRVNFYGLLLTPILRPALRGNVPIHLVHSSLARTGKTKLIEQVFGGIIVGRSIPALQFSGTEEERDKRILSILMRGDAIVHLDNLKQFLESAALASLTTGKTYMGRMLSKSEMVTADNNLTIAASGNNVRMSGELTKRTVSIQLVPASDRPEDRTDFVHPDLELYVAEARPKVLGCLLGMIENWKAEGCPSYPTVLGGFEHWSKADGGVLVSNGFADHRGNQSDWIRRADTDGEELKAFVDLWYEKFGQSTATAKELFSMATEADLFGYFLSSKSEKAQLTSFGMRVLSRHEDTPVGSFRIRKASVGSGNVWRLEPLQ